MPGPLKKFYSLFPLYIYPHTEIPPPPAFRTPKGLNEDDEDGYKVKAIAAHPTLFILPPKDASKSLLSSDIECIKWQAYLALREIHGGLRLSWSLASEGALDGQLPNLYLPPPQQLLNKYPPGSNKEIKGELLESKRITSWIDGELGKTTTDDDVSGILEGYRSEEARDESKAWLSLLEGDIDAAFVITSPVLPILTRLTTFNSPTHVQTPVLSSPLTGVSSMIPPLGKRVLHTPIMERYAEGMAALSTRLRHDKWFLGSKCVCTLPLKCYGLTIIRHSAGDLPSLTR